MAKLQDSTMFTTRDGESFEVTISKLEPVAAYKLVAKLGKILVPALVAMRQGTESDLQPVVSRMFDELPADLATEIMLDVFAAATVVRRTSDGGASKHELCAGIAEVNRAFRGNLLMLFKSLGFALKVNFDDFFDVDGLVARLTPTPSH